MVTIYQPGVNLNSAVSSLQLKPQIKHSFYWLLLLGFIKFQKTVELHDLYPTPSIIQIKSSSVIWAVHVACLVEKNAW
jgi:hypothetical protein